MKLPKEFEAYTEKLMGSELYAQLLQGLAEEPHAFVRTNPFKGASFAIYGSKGTVEWYEHGHWFADRPNFTFDPLLHAGVYYVQEKSSMFLAQVLRQHITEPVTMLDMCAAPGKIHLGTRGIAGRQPARVQRTCQTAGTGIV